MHPIAHATIAATVITSALGAFVLCLLVFRYGFEPPDDESLDSKHRRYLITRLGHAAGAVFFAITAGLAGITLGLPSPKVAEAPRPADGVAFAPARDLATLRAEHLRLGEIVHGLGQTVHGLGERVGRAEAATQRLTAVVNDAKVEDKPAPRRPPAATSRPVSSVRPTPVVVPAPRPVMAPAAMPVAVTPPKGPSSESSPQAGHVPETPQPSGMALAAAAPSPAPAPTATPAVSAASARPSVAETNPTTEPPGARTVQRRPEPVRSFASEAARFGDALLRSVANATRTVRQFVHDLNPD